MNLSVVDKPIMPTARQSLRPLLYLVQCKLLVLVAACGGSQNENSTPTDLPPLPPTANTSVGILLEEGEFLALLPDQIEKLTVIESELGAVNEPLELHLADLEAPLRPKRPTKSSDSGKSGFDMSAGGRGGGGRGGGGGMRGGGGKGGGMRGGGSKGGGMRGGRGGKPKPETGPSPEVQARAQATREMMRQNNQIALARAMEPLSPAQREQVRTLLNRHGHDIPEIALGRAEYQTAIANGVPVTSPPRRGPARCLARQLQLPREQTEQLMLWLRAKRSGETSEQTLGDILTPEQQTQLDQALKSCGIEISIEQP